MAKRIQWIAIAIGASVSFVFVAPASSQLPDKAIDLLQLPTTKLTSNGSPQRSRFGSLTDSRSVVVELAADQGDIDVLYSLGDEVVSPSELIVQWAAGDKSPKPPTIELLASTTSQHAGFRVIRSANVRDRNGPQRFNFLPTGAKWIIVRIKPVAGSEFVSLAEIQLMGKLGLPKSNYKFQESPAKAFEVLEKLEGIVNVDVSTDEKSLFEDASDGSLDKWTFAEAALIASGATEKTKRDALLAKIESIETAAKSQTDPINDPMRKGDALLGFLHSSYLTAGYVKQQTDFTTLLENQSFNCVSSAILFSVIGRRLGLDVRGIEVPDHALAIQYVGSKHADVETTNARGFDPSRRPEALQSFENQTGFRYIADRHPEKRREITPLGMVALIYFNHAVAAESRKDYGEALELHFCALSLDPEFKSSVKNVMADIANWGVELAKQNNHADAIAVINAGLALAPDDLTLRHNREFVWQRRVFDEIDAGRFDSALDLLREAHQQIPDGGYLARQAFVYIRPGEELAKQKRWDEAIQLAKSGRKEVDEPAQKELNRWATSLFLRQSLELIDGQQYEKAALALQEGLKQFPDEYRLKNNLAFVAQEALRSSTNATDTVRREKHLAEMIQDHPEIRALREVGRSHGLRLVNPLVKSGKHREAIKVAQRVQPVLSQQHWKVMMRFIYDDWAQTHTKKNEFDAAMDVYAKARVAMPDDSHFKRNASATLSRWAVELIKQEQWEQANKIVRQGDQEFGDRVFSKNWGFVLQEWLVDLEQAEDSAEVDRVAAEAIKDPVGSHNAKQIVERHYAILIEKHRKAGEYDQAIAIYQRGVSAVNQPSTAFQSNGAGIYDSHARGLKDQWAKMIDIYADGLEKVPRNRLLTQNAGVMFNRWAESLVKANELQEAEQVLKRGIKLLPGNSDVRRNLTYVQQKIKANAKAQNNDGKTP